MSQAEDLPHPLLAGLVMDFARAIQTVDSAAPVEAPYQPGIGPLREPRAVELAMAHLEQPDQVRMRQIRSPPPLRELEFRVFWRCRNEFDRSSLRFPIAMLRKEHGAVSAATQELAQVEFPIDDLAFPLLPGPGHSVSPAGWLTSNRPYYTGALTRSETLVLTKTHMRGSKDCLPG